MIAEILVVLVSFAVGYFVGAMHRAGLTYKAWWDGHDAAVEISRIGGDA